MSTPKIRSFLALCASPLLMALSASAVDFASCDYDTYMCCFTGGGVIDNTDVCGVRNSAGDFLELLEDTEGSVYCHGFGWAPDASESDILPLYQYVTSNGYSGNVAGAPQCGCLEDMPVVTNAACTRLHSDGSFGPCVSNNLRTHYTNTLHMPNGDLEKKNGDMILNLVKRCEWFDDFVPVETGYDDHDFGSCSHNTYMCCWDQRSGGVAVKDNTDVCRVGNTGYPGASEGDVHCHGFVWGEHDTAEYILGLAQQVINYNHGDGTSGSSGYFGNLPGAPQCGCIEEMPEVSRADCTMPHENPGRYRRCRGNNLRRRYEDMYPMGELGNLVDQCNNA